MLGTSSSQCGPSRRGARSDAWGRHSRTFPVRAAAPHRILPPREHRLFFLRHPPLGTARSARASWVACFDRDVAYSSTGRRRPGVRLRDLVRALLTFGRSALRGRMEVGVEVLRPNADRVADPDVCELAAVTEPVDGHRAHAESARHLANGEERRRGGGQTHDARPGSRGGPAAPRPPVSTASRRVGMCLSTLNGCEGLDVWRRGG